MSNIDYSKECAKVRKKQRKQLRKKIKKWLLNGAEGPEPVFRSSQGWHTW